MPGRADEFWNHVREHWRPQDEEEMRGAAHSILLHLRRRLPHEEVLDLFGKLPGEIVGLAYDPMYMREAHTPVRPAERHEDAPEFFATVSRDAHVTREVAECATRAVFSAMKQELPEKQVVAVHTMLPKHLKSVWSEA